MYREIWIENVKTLLSQNNLSISEAARLVGTSKQYLSAILAASEPQSMREKVLDRLSLLLHANPARLYAPVVGGRLAPQHIASPLLGHLEVGLTPVEQAIMAERHFLSRDYAGSYGIITDLMQRFNHELPPTALAQAKMLAGKCACLLGYYEAARAYLREAQALFQKRMTAQPDKYLSASVDAYRYLALVSHFESDYEGALRLQQKGLSLSARYPELASELRSKWETLGYNMLRTAVRTGKQSMLRAVADELVALGIRVGIPELIERARFEVELSAYAIARASLADAPPPQAPILSRDPLQYMAFGLILLDRRETATVDKLISSTPQELGSPDHQYATHWLKALFSEDGLPVADGASPACLAMGKIILASRAHFSGSRIQSFHHWQDGLFELRAIKEMALYLLVFSFGMRLFAEHSEDVETIKAVADRALAAYTC